MLALLGGLFLAVGLNVANDPGYLLVSFRNYTFETSLFAFFTLLVVFFCLLKLLFLLAHWINPVNLLSAGRRFTKSRMSKTRTKTAQGLISLATGRWNSAYTILLKNANEPTASVFNFLAAAEAAYQMGERELWIDSLEQAEKRYPDFLEAINIVKARLYFKSGQLEQCLALLIQLRKSTPKDPYLLNLHKEVSIALKAWPELKLLLPALGKGNLLEPDELSLIERRLVVEDLSAAVSSSNERGNAGEQGQSSEAENSQQQGKTKFASLLKIWKQVPPRYRDDEKIVAHYFSLLHGVAEGSILANTIEELLNKHWHDHLIVSYSLLESPGHAQRLLQAENWLKKRPGNPELLLALGRLCLRNELWGKAKEYLQASIKISPSTQAYAELSRLMRSLNGGGAGDHDEFLTMLEEDLPALPMPSSESLSRD